LIFRGLNFSRNADIGQIGHLWMGTSYPTEAIIKANASNENHNTCLKACEDEFIRYTARKPVGGSEILRVCRVACPQDASNENQPGFSFGAKGKNHMPNR
jgi:hypothetical protein